MKKYIIAASALLGLTSVFAQEANNNTPYIDVGYTMLTYSDSGYDFSPGAVRVVVGMNTNSNFGYEGMFGAGIVSSTKTVTGVELKSSIPTFYGVYGKAFANVGSDVEVFGRLGWAGFNGELVGNSKATNTGSGLSYGVGAKYSVSKTMTISADYMSYYPTKNTVGLSGFTIGAGFNF